MPERRSDTRACDLLAAYEMGLLDDGDRIRFENHLDDCPDCLEELYAFAPAVTALTTEPGRFARVAARTLPGPLDRLAGWLNRIFQPRVMAPVVTVAVVAHLILLPTPTRWSDLAQVEPLSWSRVAVRAGDDPGTRLFQKGMERYTAGHYAEAAGLLQQASRILSDRDQRDSRHSTLLGQTELYLGVSLLLDRNPRAAKNPLQSAAATPLPPVAQGARWYLAQAFLLMDRPDSASLVLDGLKESPVYGARSLALLEDIQIQQNR